MWVEEKVVKKGNYTYSVVKNHPNASKHGYVLTHRIVIENKIGRLLGSDEIVHHIDGNKKNNDVSNLEVMKRGEHSVLHNKKYENGHKIEIICKNCGIRKEINFGNRIELRNYNNTFCSKKCSGLYNWFKKKI